MDTGTTVAFLLVIGARFLVPLLIPRFPLPALLTALVLDGVDQTIFQTLGYDPPGYQGYDKAMDVYYLSIAYLSTLRNWTRCDASAWPGSCTSIAWSASWRSSDAVASAAADLSEHIRVLLHRVRDRAVPVGPDAGRQAVLDRHRGRDLDLRQAAPGVLDPHRAARLHRIARRAPVAVGGRGCAAPRRGARWRFAVLRPRLPARGLEPGTSLPIRCPPADRHRRRTGAWVAAHGRVLSLATLEKVVLVGLLCVIYGQVLPDVGGSGIGAVPRAAVFVVVNAALSLWVLAALPRASAPRSWRSARVVVNVALVLLAGWLLGRGEGEPQAWATRCSSSACSA